jgi:hypothetical protein
VAAVLRERERERERERVSHPFGAVYSTCEIRRSKLISTTEITSNRLAAIRQFISALPL